MLLRRAIVRVARSGAMLILCTSLLVAVGSFALDSTTVYREDFESGYALDWSESEGWDVIQEAGGNWVYRGREHFTTQYGGERWGDHTLKLRVKLIRERIHINYRLASDACTRYFIAFGETFLDINKTYPCEVFHQLAHSDADHQRGRWYEVEIVGRGGTLEVYVDGVLRVSCTDPDPLLYGSIALETGPGWEACVDDIEVLGHSTPTGLSWVRTGGPLGGLGYDIRMRPDNPDIMYVTDAYSGIHMSTDGGRSWRPSNTGITARVGNSGDAIPVFSLTIDPHDHDILWAGTDGVLGIYKSVDAGRTWTKMVNGVEEQFGITFRGFTVDPRISDIVYAAAEVHDWWWAGHAVMGPLFNKQKGVVYRTTNGGMSWSAVWRGDSLARYVWIDPRDPDVIYISTGFMDRDAANSDFSKGIPGGEGVFKSVDGGRTWLRINTGLENLYVGSLFMHPEDPSILLAGVGNNPYEEGSGVYLSMDGGATWDRRLIGVHGEMITAVEFALSNPDIAYAGSQHSIYRSDDEGGTWQVVSGGWSESWGPQRTNPGFPVDFQVDPRDPDRVFVNCYMGGNFVSEDGGHTWSDASKGYTGAQMRGIAVDPANANRVLAVGRSGIWESLDGGDSWRTGTPTLHMCTPWYTIAIDPSNPQHTLGGYECAWALAETRNGGRTWRQVSSLGTDIAHGKCWRSIAFAPAKPLVVYAATSYLFGTDWVTTVPAEGLFVSRDGGSTWAKIASQQIPEDANVTALAISPVDENTVYAATGSGGFLRSSDGGQTWAVGNSGLPLNPVIWTIACHPADPAVLYAGLDRAAIYRSFDGGVSWQPSSAGMNPEAIVSDIVFDPTNPDVVFATDRMSGVYRSLDGGSTWQAINQGLRMREVNALAIALDLDTPSGVPPVDDRDNDGVPDDEDYCPDFPGREETNGC